MISETTYLHFFNSLSEGNKSECIRILNEQLENKAEVKDIYTKLIQRSMYKIGNLWEKNKTSVANEHIASNINACLLNILYPHLLNGNKNGKTIVVTCIDKEFHEMGARIVSDFFEYNGWDSIYLGANTPQNDIIEIVEQRKPELIGISCNFYMNVLRLLKFLGEITTKFPNQKIIIGGQAINSDNLNMFSKFKNVSFLPDLDGIEKYLKKNFKK